MTKDQQDCKHIPWEVYFHSHLSNQKKKKPTIKPSLPSPPLWRDAYPIASIILIS